RPRPAPSPTGGPRSPARRRASAFRRSAPGRVARIRLLRRGRSRRRTAVLLAVMLGVVLSGILAGSQVALAVLDGTLGRFPDPHTLEADSLVYDRSGELIAQLH